MALDLSRTQLQAIGGRADSSRKNRALTMLRSWIKNLELRVDRVSNSSYLNFVLCTSDGNQ